MKEKLNLINKLIKFYTNIIYKVNDYTVSFTEIKDIKLKRSHETVEIEDAVGWYLAYLGRRYQDVLTELMDIYNIYLDDCCTTEQYKDKNIDEKLMQKLYVIMSSEDMEFHRMKIGSRFEPYEENERLIDFNKYLKSLRSKHNKIMKEYKALSA